MNWKRSSTPEGEARYGIAAEVAARAGNAANIAWKAISEYNDRKPKAVEWDKIMATSYVAPFTIAFVVVCILEYSFSREIYRDMLSDAPWIIGIGLIAISIVVAELMVGMFSSNTRERRFYEEKLKKINETLPDEDINAKIKKHTLLCFILGTVFFLGIGFAIYYLSVERVNREIEAKLRSSAFGIQDWFPVICYAIEVLTGFFNFYLFKRISIEIILYTKRNKSEKKHSILSKKNY